MPYVQAKNFEQNSSRSLSRALKTKETVCYSCNKVANNLHFCFNEEFLIRWMTCNIQQVNKTFSYSLCVMSNITSGNWSCFDPPLFKILLYMKVLNLWLPKTLTDVHVLFVLSQSWVPLKGDDFPFSGLQSSLFPSMNKIQMAWQTPSSLWLLVSAVLLKTTPIMNSSCAKRGKLPSYSYS